MSITETIFCSAFNTPAVRNYLETKDSRIKKSALWGRWRQYCLGRMLLVLTRCSKCFTFFSPLHYSLMYYVSPPQFISFSSQTNASSPFWKKAVLPTITLGTDKKYTSMKFGSQIFNNNCLLLSLLLCISKCKKHSIQGFAFRSGMTRKHQIGFIL